MAGDVSAEHFCCSQSSAIFKVVGTIIWKNNTAFDIWPVLWCDIDLAHSDSLWCWWEISGLAEFICVLFFYSELPIILFMHLYLGIFGWWGLGINTCFLTAFCETSRSFISNETVFIDLLFFLFVFCNAVGLHVLYCAVKTVNFFM